jgi:hypothetical protein
LHRRYSHWVFEQLQGDLDELGAVGEVLGRGGQPFGQASLLTGSFSELGLIFS